jgi:phenylacetate-CoA ligase
MTVKVEARSGSTSQQIWADCSRDLSHRIKSLIGVSAAVNTVAPGSIERSMGKAKRVIDMRAKD